MKITEEMLYELAPNANEEIVKAIAATAERVLTEYEMDRPLRVQHLFAHILTETGGLRRVEENMNYSAQRLLQVFPKYFKSMAVAKRYERKPQEIANRVYGGRMGNVDPNDGWLNRGQGLLQTTGRYNMEKLCEYMECESLDELRELLVDPENMFECAVVNFIFNNAVAPADRDDIVGSTKAVNGGSHGLKERREYLAACKEVLVFE